MKGDQNTSTKLQEKHQYKPGEKVRIYNDGVISDSANKMKGQIVTIKEVGGLPKPFYVYIQKCSKSGIWIDEIECRITEEETIDSYEIY